MRTNRLTDLVHYIIWRCKPADLGATKLNKICWYVDLETYRSTGRALTGAEHYKRLQHGPVPKNMLQTFEALEREGRIARAKENYFGFPKTMFMALSRPNLDAFTAAEIATIDAIADAICHNHTAVSISEASHDALWQELELGDDIPVGAASVYPGEATAEDLAWAQQAIASAE